MEYIRLGQTELTVSHIGFGCWAMGGHGWGRTDDALSVESVWHALDAGVNFFDTADVYGFGHSEEVLSKALGEKRHSVVIATKCGVTWDEHARIGRDLSARHIVKAAEDSLRRLRIDCIPLYQIHWPDERTPIAETMEALLKLQTDGKIQHIGCSNFPVDLVREAQQVGTLQSLQVPFNLLRCDPTIDEAIRYSARSGLSVLGYDTLAKGLLTGKFSAATTFGTGDVRSRDEQFKGERFAQNLQLVKTVKELGSRYGKTPAQVAIRWVLDAPGMSCALVGIKRPDQVQDNIGATGWHLSKDDWTRLADQAASLRPAHEPGSNT